MISWFARNGVAANLLMLAIAAAGVATILSGRIPVEVFPSSESRTITVSVPYRGATPEEVEESVVVRVEEAIADVSGIEEMRSFASEGNGSVSVEVSKGYDVREVLDDIKAAVDSISTFPSETERPRISKGDTWRHVISVVVYGDLDERDMRALGEHIRDDIAALPTVSEADLQGVRPFEISIEIDEPTLQRYNIGFEQVSLALRASSVDVPAGTLKTAAGDVSLRSRGRAYNKEDFENIVITSRGDGSRVLLKDIARVDDGFDENQLLVRFNGRRCVLIAINREGNQNAIQIAEDVRQFMADYEYKLPEGVSIGYWSDMSRIVKSRLDVLLDSGMKSILLVFLVLTLFLRPSLAFWVVIGIPICFLGATALMPVFGVTINISSLFGFILVLGVVVDDAIVTGENIYTHQQRGDKSMLKSSIKGTREVAIPVIFGILTTIIAFVPQLFGEGFHGTYKRDIAIIVMAVLAFSLIESKLILPSHLTHSLRERLNSFCSVFTPKALRNGVAQTYEATFGRLQKAVAGSLMVFIDKVYRPFLSFALVNRYFMLSIFIGGLLIMCGFYFSGSVPRIKFPRVASERATARLTMQEGTPFEVTEGHVMRMEKIVREMQAKYSDENGVSIIEDIMTGIGGQGVSSSRRRGSRGEPHKGEVTFYVVEPENRSIDIDSRALAAEWRDRIGPIVGAKELYFRAEIGRGGEPIDIQLSAQNIDQIKPVVEKIREHLGSYAELFDIGDSLDQTREEIQLSIRPEAEQFDLSMAELANQVRQAFYGEEVQRLQRGRDDLRVMLRYPEANRRSLEALEAMMIRTRDGAEVPFGTVAEAVIGESFPRIQRIDRNRTINVTADADKTKADIPNLREKIGEHLDTLLIDYPGVRWSFEGEAADERESNKTQQLGIILLVLAIYAMLAIPFRSYVQPLIVMSVIPFGFVGAVVGHIFEGWRRLGISEWWAMGPSGWRELSGAIPISEMSEFGMIALAGIVVNDSLVLVDYINRQRRKGIDALTAVRNAGSARFRAIVLTSFTTFAGLMPLLALKSTQAQFLIPMAISLGYGILFATCITLVLVPINYLILEDIKNLYVSEPETKKKKKKGKRSKNRDATPKEALPTAG
jgi:multidrug efflux pump subunit AcrB